MENIQLLTLDNGINVLICNDNRTDLILSSVNISVGSNAETPNIAGLAHVCEHVLFSNKYKTHNITNELHDRSNLFNAGTSYDQTYYYILSYKDEICNSVDMLHNIYTESSFLEEDLEKEKRIVIEEYHMTMNYVTHMLKNMYSYLFGKEGGSKMITIGTLETIKSFTKKHITEFKRQYLPELTTLIFLGNIKNDLLIESLKKTFGTVKNNKEVSNGIINYKPTFVNTEGYIHYYPNTMDNSSQCVILLAFKSFPMFDRNNVATDLITYTLNNFILFNKLRLEKGTTYSSKTYNFCNKNHGLFMFNTSVEFKYLMIVLSTLADIFKDIKQNGISDDYIKRSVKKIRMSNDLNFLNFTNYHMWYNSVAIATRELSKFYTPEQYLSKCENTTSNDIKLVANELFNPKECYVEIIGPTFPYAHLLVEFFLKF